MKAIARSAGAWRRGFVPAVVGLLILAGRVPAAQVEADPTQEYHVTPAAGPWMICVASYMGEPAAKLAHDLVLEVRQKYNLPAFVFNRGDEERRQQQQELEEKRRQQLERLRQMGFTGDLPLRHRTVRIEDQYAVLIGGYPDLDAAHRALDQVKKLQAPQSVPTQTISSMGLEPGADSKKVEHKLNPFATSFVVRNPTVPVDHLPQESADYDFLKKLNEYEPLSLLRCGKPWTLAVQEFGGEARILPEDQTEKSSSGFLDQLFGHRSGPTQLDAAAQNAHNLGEALRKMGFEAYVLHTRYSSVVTVGGFDSPEDPHLRQVQQALAGNVLLRADPSNCPGQVDPQRVNQQVQFLPKLIPVRVPQSPKR